MKILLILIFAPLIALALLYFLFPEQLVRMMRALMRRRARLVRKSITVDGRTWPYLEGGDPSKPTLVMIHGFGADKDHWTFYAPWMTRDYRLIAPDLPGFGENDRDGGLPFDVASQAARLKGFLDALGIDRPHLGGNSMGGWIALRFAIDYPDRLRTLTLMNNAGVVGANESELQKLAATRDYNPLVLANLEDADRLIAFVVRKPPFVPARLKPAIYADALRHRDLLDRIFWIIADEMEQAPLNDDLGKVQVPTLILWGRHDKLIDVSCVAVLEKGIANSRAHIFEHVAHVPMIEDPKATAEIQRAFLADHP
ncbi:alpha/beta fold hydrolase [Sphingopyxis sp. FD7]|jgi:pimeloyl-ACP methyl ester carboxylesterase|uniref:alpha/beta fold hydrolase n=1 Tax=Sphingopyxis sp. FD7 TaxID=1914525 RepID=UPI000DC62BA9|nr:alpha/beta fold hydrolase [Sphingopyxis sp. FD7]BBB13018.1 alpha/beta hydrolase [Sphingopyxis sp. FD7]